MALYGTKGCATNYWMTQVRWCTSKANIRVVKVAERTGESTIAKHEIGICDTHCNLDSEPSFAVGTIVTWQLANVGVGCGLSSQLHPWECSGGKTWRIEHLSTQLDTTQDWLPTDRPQPKLSFTWRGILNYVRNWEPMEERRQDMTSSKLVAKGGQRKTARDTYHSREWKKEMY